MSKGRVEIAAERCKGCGLCVEACHQEVLEVSDKLNSNGHRYVQAVRPDDCIGCTFCGMVCPDVALRVYREKNHEGV